MNETVTKTRDYAGVTTKQIIVEMLTENTGRALCDSGDYYGRNWSRNQGRDFGSGLAATCSWSVYRKDGEAAGRLEPDTGVSLYHWMVHNLSFDAEMQTRLDLFSAGREEDGCLELADMFSQHEHDPFDHEREPECVNTYNNTDDCHLSQVLQFSLLFTEDKYEPSHIVLSVHGGCDVRGGYTEAKCFTLRRELHEFWDSMRVDCVYAGDHRWYYGDGCWRDCDANEDNVCDAPDPCKLPCFDLEWADDLDSKLAELRAAIGNAQYQRGLLAGTNLSPAQIKVAEAEMDKNLALLEAEYDESAIGLLAEIHGDFTYVKDGKAFLVYLDDDGLAQAHEMTAGNCYL